MCWATIVTPAQIHLPHLHKSACLHLLGYWSRGFCCLSEWVAALLETCSILRLNKIRRWFLDYKIISQMLQNLRLWDVEVEVVWQVILAFEAQHPPHWVHLGRGRGVAAGRRETHFTIYNLCDASVLLHCVSVKSTQCHFHLCYTLQLSMWTLNR